MKIIGGKTEGGIVVGNTFDKYGSKNPIVKMLMHNFHMAINDAVSFASPSTILEIGCGEGYWVARWFAEGIDVRGVDYSKEAIRLAKENLRASGINDNIVSTKNIYELNQSDRWADLVVCCEVLEHLHDPLLALEILNQVSFKYLLLSVPREPLWRIMNLGRARYLTQLGNTPGHIQHWSRREFVELVSTTFDVIKIYSPIPWTVVLCKSRPVVEKC